MKKNTILWADDDVDDLMLMREILQKYGKDHDIIEVKNGKEALEFLEQAGKDLPSLIILDINMPVMDGKETLSIIKNNEAYKNIPVVVFTTSASEMDKMFCKRFNTKMVTKPPSYTSLESTVIELLETCGL